MQRISHLAILGAGPGALGFATDCTRRGIEVLVWTHKDHQRRRKAIEERGHLPVQGLFRDRVKLRFTSCPREAAGFSSVFAMSIRGDAHADTWREFEGLDLSSHTVIFFPGSCVRQRIPSKIRLANIVTTNSTPVSTLATEEGINILGKKACLAATSTDARLHGPVQALFAPVKLDWVANEMDLVTQHPSGVFHPPIMIGNAHRIQRGDDFRFYVDGLTDQVTRMLLDVDSVRCRIREALGFSRVDALDTVNNLYGTSYKTIETWKVSSPIHNTMKAPTSLDNRMLVEDVRVHWALWHDMARLLGLDATPLREGIAKASELMGEDYFATGMTLDKIGLGDCSREAFCRKFETGDVAGHGRGVMSRL